jgi:hypothetical protein
MPEVGEVRRSTAIGRSVRKGSRVDQLLAALGSAERVENPEQRSRLAKCGVVAHAPNEVRRAAQLLPLASRPSSTGVLEFRQRWSHPENSTRRENGGRD